MIISLIASYGDETVEDLFEVSNTINAFNMTLTYNDTQ